MGSKTVAGSIMASTGLLVAATADWLKHYFFVIFHMAEAMQLRWTGSFDPAPYIDPANVDTFIGTQIAAWIFMFAGLALIGIELEEQGYFERFKE